VVLVVQIIVMFVIVAADDWKEDAVKRLIVCLALLFVLGLLESDGSGQQPKKRTRPRGRAESGRTP
jgi:hypothetical protein